jgi:NAD(P)-dependent dehydrogenase (short-subunit alcohol dehydrogenase family)
MTLKGKTLFITGASRGIGLAIAKRAAADGANVVIAAKTTDPNPKLPGTIYSAAEEIKAVGGQALPLAVDIRDEAAVVQAVAQAVETFGGIDILVNNASAISLTGTEQTPMKRYDLMNGVNARDTYVCTQACLPQLKKSAAAGRNPHVLNTSPPLSMEQHWFAPHTAYTMAKRRDEHVHAGPLGRVQGVWHRRQQPVAAHGDCHRRAADDPRRGRQHVPHTGDSFRRGVLHPHQSEHGERQLLHRR